MCVKLCVFGSGSKGNCTYVGYGSTHILIDMGLPIRRIEKCLSVLGVDPASVSILVTHEHSDHIKTLGAFVKKYACPVFAFSGSQEAVCNACEQARQTCSFFDIGDFFVGDFVVTPFEVSHDVPCVGYTLSAGRKRLSVMTDIGKMTPSVMRSVTGSDLVVIESNHDCEMLRRNQRYSAFLKKRILSPHGHLSNDDCAEALCALAATGTKQAVLAHLSDENNCPEVAFETVKRVLENRGYTEGKDIKIEVAEQNKISAMFEIS